jgi:hypothetical protein
MDGFNVKAECDCCNKEKDNCIENVVREGDEIKVELICKECWEYMNRLR